MLRAPVSSHFIQLLRVDGSIFVSSELYDVSGLSNWAHPFEIHL
jgi:hypothetical protein